MISREDLIQQLSHELKPITPLPSLVSTTTTWLIFSAILIILMTYINGPIRENAIKQLLTSPQFFIETLVGITAISLLALTAFKSAIPAALNNTLLYCSYGLLALWLCFYLYGVSNPALTPSMLGKREHCLYEGFIYSLTPIVFAFILTKKYCPLKPFQCAISFSLAAGMLPALYMQIACMYEPLHIIKLHCF